MGIWDFDTFETDDLERIMEMASELQEMGLDVLDEDMLAEVQAELERRAEDDEDNVEDV
jgi:hypothetical protein